ncbi:unnamed protein product [Caenorhabditis brenneri]
MDFHENGKQSTSSDKNQCVSTEEGGSANILNETTSEKQSVRVYGRAKRTFPEWKEMRREQRREERAKERARREKLYIQKLADEGQPPPTPEMLAKFIQDQEKDEQAEIPVFTAMRAAVMQDLSDAHDYLVKEYQLGKYHAMTKEEKYIYNQKRNKNKIWTLEEVTAKFKEEEERKRKRLELKAARKRKKMLKVAQKEKKEMLNKKSQEQINEHPQSVETKKRQRLTAHRRWLLTAGRKEEEYGETSNEPVGTYLRRRVLEVQERKQAEMEELEKWRKREVAKFLGVSENQNKIEKYNGPQLPQQPLDRHPYSSSYGRSGTLQNDSVCTTRIVQPTNHGSEMYKELPSTEVSIDEERRKNPELFPLMGEVNQEEMECQDEMEMYDADNFFYPPQPSTEHNRSPVVVNTVVIEMPSSPSSSSQTTEECKVCGDRAKGFHYGVVTCEGCKAFFRRNKGNPPVSRCLKHGNCEMTARKRTNCQPCRFKKCLEAGMIENEGKQVLRLRNSPAVPENTTKEANDHQTPQERQVYRILKEYSEVSKQQEKNETQEPLDRHSDAVSYSKTARKDPVRMTNKSTKTGNPIMEKESQLEEESVRKTTDGKTEGKQVLRLRNSPAVPENTTKEANDHQTPQEREVYRILKEYSEVLKNQEKNETREPLDRHSDAVSYSKTARKDPVRMTNKSTKTGNPVMEKESQLEEESVRKTTDGKTERSAEEKMKIIIEYKKFVDKKKEVQMQKLASLKAKYQAMSPEERRVFNAKNKKQLTIEEKEKRRARYDAMKNDAGRKSDVSDVGKQKEVIQKPPKEMNGYHTPQTKRAVLKGLEEGYSEEVREKSQSPPENLEEVDAAKCSFSSMGYTPSLSPVVEYAVLNESTPYDELDKNNASNVKNQAKNEIHTEPEIHRELLSHHPDATHCGRSDTYREEQVEEMERFEERGVGGTKVAAPFDRFGLLAKKKIETDKLSTKRSSLYPYYPPSIREVIDEERGYGAGRAGYHPMEIADRRSNVSNAGNYEEVMQKPKVLYGGHTPETGKAVMKLLEDYSKQVREASQNPSEKLEERRVFNEKYKKRRSIEEKEKTNASGRTGFYVMKKADRKSNVSDVGNQKKVMQKSQEANDYHTPETGRAVMKRRLEEYSEAVREETQNPAENRDEMKTFKKPGFLQEPLDQHPPAVDYENSDGFLGDPDCMTDTSKSSRVEYSISGVDKKQHSAIKQVDNEDPLGVTAEMGKSVMQEEESGRRRKIEISEEAQEISEREAYVLSNSIVLSAISAEIGKPSSVQQSIDYQPVPSTSSQLLFEKPSKNKWSLKQLKELIKVFPSEKSSKWKTILNACTEEGRIETSCLDEFLQQAREAILENVSRINVLNNTYLKLTALYKFKIPLPDYLIEEISKDSIFQLDAQNLLVFCSYHGKNIGQRNKEMLDNLNSFQHELLAVMRNLSKDKKEYWSNAYISSCVMVDKRNGYSEEQLIQEIENVKKFIASNDKVSYSTRLRILQATRTAVSKEFLFNVSKVFVVETDVNDVIRKYTAKKSRRSEKNEIPLAVSSLELNDQRIHMKRAAEVSNCGSPDAKRMKTMETVKETHTAQPSLEDSHASSVL